MRNEILLSAFADNLRIKTIEDPLEFLGREIVLSHSQKSKKMIWRKWMKDVFLQSIKPETKQTCLLASPGLGKTTLLLQMLSWYTLTNPLNTLIVFPTETEANIFEETQYNAIFESSPALKKLIPTGKGKNVKGTKVLNNCIHYIKGSSINNLQSKSCPLIFIDEVWQQKTVNESIQRQHDHFQSKRFFISQGQNITEENSDWYNSYHEGSIFEWYFLCPDCNDYFLPDLEKHLKYTITHDENGNYEWDKIEESLYLECPHCQAKHLDTPNTREKLTENGKFVKTSNGKKGYYSYRVQRLAGLDIEWKVLMAEKIQAEDAWNKGSFNLWEVFNTKRLAKFYNNNEYVYIDNTYFETEREIDENGIVAKVLSIDTQMDGFYSAVVAFWDNGSFGPIDWEKHLTIEEVEDFRIKYDVPPNRTIIDAAYKPHIVNEYCKRYKYIAIKGTDRSHFVHVLKNGQRIHRPYSPQIKTVTGRGMSMFYTNLATPTLNHLFFEMKDQGLFRLPKLSEDNLDKLQTMAKHLSSTVVNLEKTKNGGYKKTIKTLNKNNHYFDVCSNSLMLSCCYGWTLQPNIIQPAQPENPESPESEKA